MIAEKRKLFFSFVSFCWEGTSRQPDKVCLGWKMAMQAGGSFRAGLASF